MTSYLNVSNLKTKAEELVNLIARESKGYLPEFEFLTGDLKSAIF
jgi:hypothetical protein